MAEYPFHRIRKDHRDGEPLRCNIHSISYSSFPAIRSGGGQGSLGRVRHFHDRKIKWWHGRPDEFSRSLGGGVGR